MSQDTVSEFRGGPLGDERRSGVHSLVVHMSGDGGFSVGYYLQVGESGVFEWHEQPEWSGE